MLSRCLHAERTETQIPKHLLVVSVFKEYFRALPLEYAKFYMKWSNCVFLNEEEVGLVEAFQSYSVMSHFCF